MDDDFSDLERDFAIIAKWIGAAIAILVILAWASVALGVPRARNAQECYVAADMAVVARALAEEAVEPGKAGAIMRHIYDVSDSARGATLMQTILESAYRQRESAPEFAKQLLTACIVSGGDMDSILGTRL